MRADDLEATSFSGSGQLCYSFEIVSIISTDTPPKGKVKSPPHTSPFTCSFVSESLGEFFLLIGRNKMRRRRKKDAWQV